tara:strand:+ start:2322 stop:2615 length:294 start_codon:yes stop_codon:yes gene_type:complete
VSVVTIAKFLLTNSIKKAIKKYGRDAVDKAIDSKTYKNLRKKSGVDEEVKLAKKQFKKIYGGGAVGATAVTGYVGYKEKNPRSPQNKKNKKLDTYTR